MPAVYDSLRILDSSSLATSQASYLHVYWSSKEWCFSSCLVCLSLLIFSEVKVLYSSFYFPLLWYLLYSTLLHSKIGSMVKSMCLLFQKTWALLPVLNCSNNYVAFGLQFSIISSFRVSAPLFWPMWAPGIHMHNIHVEKVPIHKTWN